MMLLAIGRLDEAVAQLQRAVALDPEEGSLRSWLGLAYLANRDLDAAVAEFERGPSWPEFLWHLSYAHHSRGDDARAADVLLESAPPAAVAIWREAFEEQGYAGIVRAALGHEVSTSDAGCTRDPARAASMLAVLAEDLALACLDEALRLKRPLRDVKWSPAYDPYRSDPRFAALLRRMNLAE
jgi:tetratricopeptide (TPR) repeat protein